MGNDVLHVLDDANRQPLIDRRNVVEKLGQWPVMFEIVEHR